MSSRNRKHSILKKLTLFLSTLLAVQCIIFSCFILFGGPIDRLEQNAMDILSERTLNRKNYMESEMLQRWSGLERAQAQIAGEVSAYLEETGMDYTDLSANDPRTVQLVVDLSDQITALIRRNSVTGAFLVLNGAHPLNQPETGNIRFMAGVYYRDLDPSSTPTDNSDLLMERGPSQLVRSVKIPMDINWAPTFSVDRDDASYYAPLLAAVEHPSAALEDLGYWHGPYSLHDDQVSIVTYTQPLRDASGRPYGVLGIELTADYLRTLLPYSELDSGKNDAYLLAVSPAGYAPGVYQPVVTSGPSALWMLPSSGDCQFSAQPIRGSVYETTGDSSGGSRVYASIQKFSLYNTNAPFADQEWVLVGLSNASTLFSFSRSITVSVLMLTVITLILGSLLSVLMVSIFTRPIRTLARTVRHIDPAQPVSLPAINMDEIDDLSSAIEGLSLGVADASSRLSKIIEIAGMPLAAYHLDPGLSRPYYTKEFFPLLGMEEPLGGVTTQEFLALLDGLRQYMEEGDPESNTALYRLPGGRWVRIQMVRSGPSVLGVLVDVTDDVVEKRRIEYERDYDLLTNLLNRRSFRARISALEAQPEQLKTAAMLMMDLDNLKYLNDTYGHDCGDEYIRCAADVLRDVTAGGGLASRISGDEFYLFLSGYDSREALMKTIADFKEKMSAASILLPDGHVHRLRASVGVAWYPDDSTSLTELTRFADFAMYEAKNALKGTVKDFDVHSYQRDSFLLYSQEELNRILETGAIDYVFQPIVDCATGIPLGYEALMRPRSKALAAPAELLRIARAQSKLSQVEQLTWFRAIEAFQALPEKGEDTLVFINSIPSQALSPAELADFDALAQGFHHRIVMELTEEDELSATATDAKQQRAKELHMGIAIDDFGTGYSNDSVLLSVSPDYVKADMAIIRGVDHDEKRQAVFQNLAALCHEMGVKVIAEGVETRAEMETVIRLGADYIQGFFTGKPETHPSPIDPAVVEALRSAWAGRNAT